MSVAAETPVAVEVPARDRVRAIAVPAATVGVPMLLVAGLALANGGSEPTQWGWVALLLLWTGATGVLLTRLELAWFDVLFLGGLMALLGWVAASLLWTNDVSHTLDEIQRVAVYPAAALAALGLGSRRALPQITAGVWAGGVVACAYALSTRLLPETFGDFDSTTTSYRLTDPFPYWNMLGGLAGLSLVVALGLAVRAQPVWLRCLAAASLPLLALTLYFTFSRGGMAATGVALLVMLLLDPSRTRLATEGIVLSVIPAVAVYAASQRDGLTRRDAPLSVAADDGRSIALLLLVLMGAAVIVTLLLTVAERRITLSSDLRTAWTVILFGGLIALAVAATIPRGGPVDVVAGRVELVQRRPGRHGRRRRPHQPPVRRVVQRPQGAVDGRARPVARPSRSRARARAPSRPPSTRATTACSTPRTRTRCTSRRSASWASSAGCSCCWWC